MGASEKSSVARHAQVLTRRWWRASGNEQDRTATRTHKPTQIRLQIVEKAASTAEKSTKIGLQSDLGRFRAILVAQGRRKDALGRAQDRSRTARGRCLGASDAAKSAQEGAKSGPRALQDRPRATRKQLRTRSRRQTRRGAPSHRFFDAVGLARACRGENVVTTLLRGLPQFLQGFVRSQ